jgi:solute carrier family 32 (vesicular inhibitory amino acid transporter)
MAAEWKEEEHSAPEEKDIEDCLLGDDDDDQQVDAAEENSLDSQPWPRSFRCVRVGCILSRTVFIFLS